MEDLLGARKIGSILALSSLSKSERNVIKEKPNF